MQKIGAYCDIHQGVNIGQNHHEKDVPTIGIMYGLAQAQSCLGISILQIIFQLEQMLW